MEGSIELIEHVVETTGTKVSIGHSAATPKEIRRAVDAGATLATHVGNGISDQIHRHINTLWPILADDRLTAMLITDGFHLPEEFVRVAIKAKGAERIIVTSDIVHLAGCRPGEYQFHGVDVVLEANGHLHRKGAYQLSGSSRDMLDCMNYLAKLKLLRESELADVGAYNALKHLGADALRTRDDPHIAWNGSEFRIVALEAERQANILKT
jgi:N-acetylglucosamine-6-phosphate deacetylase